MARSSAKQIDLNKMPDDATHLTPFQIPQEWHGSPLVRNLAL